MGFWRVWMSLWGEEGQRRAFWADVGKCLELKMKPWHVREMGGSSLIENCMGKVLSAWWELTTLTALLFLTQVDSFCEKCGLNISGWIPRACGLEAGRDQSWDGWMESDTTSPFLWDSQDGRHWNYLSLRECSLPSGEHSACPLCSSK